MYDAKPHYASGRHNGDAALLCDRNWIFISYVSGFHDQNFKDIFKRHQTAEHKMHSMRWWFLPSVNVSALVKDLMLKWHSSVVKLQEYFDVFCKREIFYELSTLLTFGRFALRCTKFNGAFIYGTEGWVLLVIKTNTLPLEYCDAVLWTWLNSGKMKREQKRNTRLHKWQSSLPHFLLLSWF